MLNDPNKIITQGPSNFLTDNWVWHLFVILLGYGTIFVPGYFIVQYFKQRKHNYTDSGFLSYLITSCVLGRSHDRLGDDPSAERGSYNLAEKSALFKAGNLLFCFVGLQISYLTWGVLQEKIMTKEYYGRGNTPGKFKDSQFLVFVNRILAFVIALIYIKFSKQPPHTAPLYKYSYCSFSNIMSSWFQYEALKYVTFPTQVLAKASKIIPTMIMGKLVSGNKYEYYEYVSAVFISVGMTIFLMSSKEHGKGAATTTLSGVVILVGYMAFDSFTSNWQGRLFNQYSMSSVQMMLGVNLFSCLLTTVSLLQQGGFSDSFVFMLTYPTFVWDCVILSICSACGQLFIYYTISSFGPVIFIIIMTIRQCLAVLLSCLLYNHPLSLPAAFGILVVFASIFLRIYCNFRLKQIKKSKGSALQSKV